MNSNLGYNHGIKELLFKKLLFAVTSSILCNILVLFTYLVIINFNVDLSTWINQILYPLTSFSTWLYILLFISIVFAQAVICAKDYVFNDNYRLSRFYKFIAIFSMRTFVLGVLYITVACLMISLYLLLYGGSYQSLYFKCKNMEYCLNEGTFFIILSGIWSGLYFFIKMYISNKKLVFPVINQSKLLYFKSRCFNTLAYSKNAAFYPTLCYIIMYYVFGAYLVNAFVYTFKLHVLNEGFSITLYIFVWMFTVLYIFNMKIMEFFFELFLTEPIQFPLTHMYDNAIPLSDALMLHNMPILQHLACLDLYLLSIWSQDRRQILFTLSQPGGHAYIWNRLVQEALTLVTNFTEKLNKAANVLLTKDDDSKPLPYEREFTKPGPHQIMYNLPKPMNIRSLGYIQSPTEFPHLPRNGEEIVVAPEATNTSIKRKVYELYQVMTNSYVVRYVFEELPEVEIQECLKNGQLIAWLSQGLSNIVVASFSEDPYGVIQKDLPLLITTLVTLKQSLEKLNRLPHFSRRGPEFDDYSFKMKNSVNSAAKQSLCNICQTFGKYLRDISLKQEIYLELQLYL